MGALKLNIATKFVLGVALIMVVVLGAQFFVFNSIVFKQQEKSFVSMLRGIAITERSMTSWMSEHEIKEVDEKGEEDPHAIPPLVGLSTAQAAGREYDLGLEYILFPSHDPDNKPDDFEREALQAFGKDPVQTEFYKREVIGGQPLLRFAVPIRTEKSCLKCHGMQEWYCEGHNQAADTLKVGELIAALVITAPTDELNRNQAFNTILSLTIVFLTLCFIAAGIYVMTTKFVRRPLLELESIMAAIAEEESPKHMVPAAAVTEEAELEKRQPTSL